jgi:bifunctional DNA-binding transcriptional regulator/antitoxin component of YhaV-PrlF toxin-antitoxin module
MVKGKSKGGVSMDYINEIKIAYENGDSISKIKRDFGLKERWFIWVYQVGQGNDFFVVGEKSALKRVKEDLEAIFEEFKKKVKEIEESDDENYNEKILEAEEEFSNNVSMALEFYNDVDGVEVFSEDSRNYFKIDNNLLIVKGNSLYLARWLDDVKFY